MPVSKLNVAIVSLPLALSLAGCSGRQIATDPSIKLAQSNSLPAPGPQDAFINARPYRIGPLDKLHIEVYGVPDLQRDVQTDALANFSYPLIGIVDAAGKTPGEIASEIAGRLGQRYVRSPQVTVNLVEAVSQLVTVDGEVVKPGPVPVIGDMTLIKAVAAAGGISELASAQDVVILRTAGGQKYAALYNLEAIRRGNYADPTIYGNDIIIVGQSKARRLFKDLATAAPILTTPLFLILR